MELPFVQTLAQPMYGRPGMAKRQQKIMKNS
jgi:hypothetical protein